MANFWQNSKLQEKLDCLQRGFHSQFGSSFCFFPQNQPHHHLHIKFKCLNPHSHSVRYSFPFSKLPPLPYTNSGLRPPPSIFPKNLSYLNPIKRFFLLYLIIIPQMLTKTNCFTITPIIIALTLSLIDLALGQEIICDYNSFCQEFDRAYLEEGSQEWRARQEIFMERCNNILQTLAEEDDYQLQLNNFTDWTDEQLNRFLNNQIPQQELLEVSSSPRKVSFSLDTDLPDQIDYRSMGKTTSAKLQGSCGSCWAFVAAAVMESQLLIEDKGNYDLSEQFILQCSGAGNCDDGGISISALNFARHKGVPEQKHLPYEKQETGLEVSQCAALKKIKLDRYARAHRARSLTQDQLKSILVEHGPVSVGVYANKNFIAYGGGIYTGCPTDSYNRINHGVVLVGYTSDGNWIVKNSWGSGWGDGGYGIISRQLDCGIRFYADYLEMSDGKVNYSLTLDDAGGDGWEGAVIGIRQQNQDGTHQQLFGDGFVSGYQVKIDDIEIFLNTTLQLFVVSKGTDPEEIKIRLYNDDDRLVYLLRSGAQIEEESVLYESCPDCDQTQYVVIDVKEEEEGLAIGVIIGISVGGLLLIVAIVLTIIICRQRRIMKEKSKSYEEMQQKMTNLTSSLTDNANLRPSAASFVSQQKIDIQTTSSMEDKIKQRAN